MSLTLDWDPPSMPPGYQCCDKYYIIFNNNISSTQIYVEVTGATSISIYPLNSSLEYYVSVSTLVKCSASCSSLSSSLTPSFLPFTPPPRPNPSFHVLFMEAVGVPLICSLTAPLHVCWVCVYLYSW